QGVIELARLCLHRLALGPAYRADHNLERRHGHWPDNAFAIVVLLDGGGHDPADADAVAAHLQRFGLALLVEIGRLELFRVLVTQEEDVPDLDAALDGQLTGFADRRIAGYDVADVGYVGL